MCRRVADCFERTLLAMMATWFVAVGTSFGQGNLPAGVEVDADGVLKTRVFDARLNEQRLAAARQNLAPELSRPSELRKISLPRLEAAVAAKLAAGESLTEEMELLAGLTEIRYVFCFPETQDIVIAGPAEPFGVDISGRPVGLATGKAVIELQDLVVALRAFPPSGAKTRVVGCSIDPTPEGLQRMQEFIKQVYRQPITPRDTNRIVEGLRESHGNQVISIQGVSPATHFAQVLVEADYRMKLIGIGLEKPPVPMQSWIARANSRAVAKNALRRWYFVPNYECVKVGEDDLSMELVGEGVKLIGENERVVAGGGRVASNDADPASDAFVDDFTEKYSQIAEKSPVYAQLRSLIDLLVAAAFIQESDYYGRSQWTMATFGDETQFAVETHQAPQHVASAINAIRRGNTLMTPIGGGVHIEPRLALDSHNRLSDGEGKLKAQHRAIEAQAVDKNRWWWD